MDTKSVEEIRMRQEEELACQKRANLLGVRYADSRNLVPKVELITDMISVEEMYRLGIAPITRSRAAVSFAITINSPQSELRQLRKKLSDFNLSFVLISDSGFKELMTRYDPPKVVAYDDVKITDEGESTTLNSVSQTFESVRSDDILDYLITQADQHGASDIHLEVEKDYVRIRFRIDGTLHAIARVTLDKYRQLSSSVAVAADISTASPQPQTSHINYTVNRADGSSKDLNIRIETTPTLYGQDAVLRLFTFERDLLNLNNLGLTQGQLDAFEEIIRHPHGMVMVVGPTGSGKTTTLYSLVDRLNDSQRKIVTLEDPIEYDFEGVSQIPVRSREQETFADRLRAVLRLDPDIIMVGEIRDTDTARTALQASLTGHLVLTTFHAANAAAALARILETIGDNPLFLSALRMIVGQRLVRRLDATTKQPYTPDEQLRNEIQAVLSTLPDAHRPSLDNLTLYKPGVSEESPFGYTGRMMISEQLHMSPEIIKLLQKGGYKTSQVNIEEMAQSQGMISMLQDGILKAVEGLTSIEEIYRVVD